MKRGLVLHPFFYGLPVYDVPKLTYVFGSSVLVVKVIGVFPYVESEEWLHALAKRIISVG